MKEVFYLLVNLPIGKAYTLLKAMHYIVRENKSVKLTIASRSYLKHNFKLLIGLLNLQETSLLERVYVKKS